MINHVDNHADEEINDSYRGKRRAEVVRILRRTSNLETVTIQEEADIYNR